MTGHEHAHHHRRRRRHHRPVAGADARPPGPSRAADRALGRAVRARPPARYAGAMLAPYCEAEAAEPVVRELGLASLALWRETYPGVTANGTLVVAGTRDRAELTRFARMTEGFDKLDAEELHALEPGLEGRFAAGLYYAEEAHMAPPAAMAFLLREAQRAGVEVSFGTSWSGGCGRRRDRHRLPGPRRPRRACRPARRARRARCIVRTRRGRLSSARCGSCIRATRSTSCRGATASSWSAPP